MCKRVLYVKLEPLTIGVVFNGEDNVRGLLQLGYRPLRPRSTALVMKVSSFFDFFDTVLILSPAQVFEGCCTNQLSPDAVGVLWRRHQ